jgi:hypothetical protein
MPRVPLPVLVTWASPFITWLLITSETEWLTSAAYQAQLILDLGLFVMGNLYLAKAMGGNKMPVPTFQAGHMPIFYVATFFLWYNGYNGLVAFRVIGFACLALGIVINRRNLNDS